MTPTGVEGQSSQLIARILHLDSTLLISLPLVDTGATHCVDSTEKLDDSLTTAGDYEDIWAFINFDECM